MFLSKTARWGTYWPPSGGEWENATFWAGGNLTLKQMLDILSSTSGRPARTMENPVCFLAYAAGYVDAGVSRLLGREPQIPGGGRPHGAAQDVCGRIEIRTRSLGFTPGPIEAALEDARSIGTKSNWLCRRRDAGRRSQACVPPKWASEFMKILVTFAVRSEFAPWQRRRSFLRLPGDWPVFEAMLGGTQIRAVLTGMGQEHALDAAKRSFAYKPDICISSGLAGSLRSDYRPGDILAARLVSEAGEPVAVASHRELLSTAVDCGARQIERLATSKKLVGRPDEKRQLGDQAEAVDMESYTILAEAARCGVPAVAIRAISDTAEFDMPYDFEQARDAQGQIRVMKVILAQVLVEAIRTCRILLKLARDSRFASKASCLSFPRRVRRNDGRPADTD